jgi:CrcB protein
VPVIALLYVLANVVLCLLAVTASWYLANFVLS